MSSDTNQSTAGGDGGDQRFELLVRTPNGQIEHLVRHGPSTIIGRDASCDVVLPSPEVSRRHLTLAWEPKGIRITDTSANGTKLNGALLHNATALLAQSTPIAIGPFEVQVKLQQEEPKPDPLDRRGTLNVSATTRREIHRRLLESLDLVRLERDRLNDRRLMAKVREGLRSIIAEMQDLLPAGTDTEKLETELADEALGLGPLQAMISDPTISEIMVVDPRVIYVERNGVIEQTDAAFTDDESVRAVLERIVAPLGRRIDESAPLLDARLSDGSRVNAVVPPLAVRGTCITIRKFPTTRWGQDDLVRFGTLTKRMATFLHRCVITRKNLLISGGTGSGKTTLLNILSSSIPSRERVVTIEDSAELRLGQPHVVTLEARPPNMEGRGEITIRDLVKNALRMRPDRILVGECRGAEALDMLQAMNTGHEGSMTTTHANSPFEAAKRIETLALMAGLDLPSRAIREQLAASLDLIVQQDRLSDGSRKITNLSEVVGLDCHGELEVREIFGFRRTGTGSDGVIEGEYYATGYLPSFIADFVVQGLVAAKGGDYL